MRQKPSLFCIKNKKEKNYYIEKNFFLPDKKFFLFLFKMHPNKILHEK